MHASHRAHHTLYQDNPQPGTWTSRRRPLKNHEADDVHAHLTRHVRALERELDDPATYAGLTAQQASRRRANIASALDMKRTERRQHGARRDGGLVRRSYKKPSDAVAHARITAMLAERHDRGACFVTAEMVVSATHIHPSIVDKAFMRLNREGVLSQGVNRKHEDFEWVATDYTIRRRP